MPPVLLAVSRGPYGSVRSSIVAGGLSGNGNNQGDAHENHKDSGPVDDAEHVLIIAGKVLRWGFVRLVTLKEGEGMVAGRSNHWKAVMPTLWMNKA